MPNTIPPRPEGSGFVFTHQELGKKRVSVSISPNPGAWNDDRYTFVVDVPGLKTESAESCVDWLRGRSGGHGRLRQGPDRAGDDFHGVAYFQIVSVRQALSVLPDELALLLGPAPRPRLPEGAQLGQFAQSPAPLDYSAPIPWQTGVDRPDTVNEKEGGYFATTTFPPSFANVSSSVLTRGCSRTCVSGLSVAKSHACADL